MATLREGRWMSLGVVRCKELCDYGAELLGVFWVRAGATTGEDMRFHVRDARDKRCPRCGCCFVVLTGNHEGGHQDTGESIHNRPVTEGAHDVELIGSVHGVVDGGLCLHLLRALDKIPGYGCHHAHVPFVESLRRAKVRGLIQGALCFVSAEGITEGVRELCTQFSCPLHPELHRCGRIAD